jgi:hypothetical protein
MKDDDQWDEVVQLVMRGTFYHEARRSHAWRLRSAGLTLEKIGDCLGVSRERARQMIAHHARWLRPRQPVKNPYWGGMQQRDVRS